MKKTILLILTAVALVLTVVSSLLCFIQNAELTSMGVKMDENLAALDYGEKLLRNPNVLSYVDIFFDSEKITPYIKNFDAEESVTFPMRLGMVAWFSIASLIGSIVFPVGGILFLVLYFKKKNVFTLKVAHIWASIGAVATLLPFTLSFAIQQNIYQIATFKFNLINPYIIVVIEAAFLIISAVVVSRLKLSNDYAPTIVYSQAAYEEGGMKYGEDAPKTKKKLGLKKPGKNTEA